jgi:hypothetical protein
MKAHLITTAGTYPWYPDVFNEDFALETVDTGGSGATLDGLLDRLRVVMGLILESAY